MDHAAPPDGSPPVTVSRKGLLLGPLLFVLGFGVLHWAINVPKSEMILRADKTGKKKKKVKGKQREHKLFKRQKRDEGFARIHEPVMHFAYELAHETALGSAPGENSFLDSAVCHRWRCQYQLCGARRHLTKVVRVLKELEHEDDGLWDAFEAKVRKTKKKGQACQRITIRFSRPSPETKGIRAAKTSIARLKKSEDARKKRAAKKARRQKPNEVTDTDGGTGFIAEPIDPPKRGAPSPTP